MSAKDTSPPTLAEQIGWISGWIDKSHAHGRKQETADFEAVKASLESIATLHSQIDGLMKRLVAADMEAEARSLYDRTAVTMGFKNAPRWNDLHDNTKQLYRDKAAEHAATMASQGGGDG